MNNIHMEDIDLFSIRLSNRVKKIIKEDGFEASTMMMGRNQPSSYKC